MRSEILTRAIAFITTTCPEGIIEDIIRNLETGSIGEFSPLSEWRRILPATVPLPIIQDLIIEWRKSKIENESVISRFETAIHTKRMMAKYIPEVELAWSGPFTNSLSLARSNYALLRDMIERANREILLVGYSFTANERTLGLLDGMAAAVQRGCKLKIALHDNGSNIETLLSNWNYKSPKPTVLKWVGNPEDSMASLHAKFLIIDNRELFIGSANMTYHGMGSNIELGLRIDGESARKISRHFFALEQAGIIIPY